MYKLLIVDDELTELKFLRFVVEKYNLPLSICGEGTTGEEAVELAEKHCPDIIIMDIHMPMKDGLEAAEAIKKRLPKTRIYLLTAYEEFEYAKRAVKISVNDYLTKPISPQQLIEVLKKGMAEILQERIDLSKANRLNRQFEQIKPALKRQLIYDLITANKINNNVLMNFLNIDKVVPDALIVVSLNASNKVVNSYNIVEKFAKDIDQAIGFGLYTIISGSKIIVFCKNYKQKLLTAVLENWRKKGYKTVLGLSYINEDKDFVRAFNTADEAYKTAVFWNKEEIYTIGETQEINSEKLNPKKLQQNTLKLLLDRNVEEIRNNLEFLLKEMEKDNLTSEQVINFSKNFVNLLYNDISSDFLSSKDLKKAQNKFASQIKKVKDKEELKNFFMELIRNLEEKLFDSDSSSAERSVQLALEYIELNYHKDINLEKVAGKLFLSSCYLSRIFKKYVGQGFALYLIKFRMEKAQQFLQTGKYSVAEVAEKVGYKDSSYFSSVFKKHMKKSPSEVGQKS